MPPRNPRIIVDKLRNRRRKCRISARRRTQLLHAHHIKSRQDVRERTRRHIRNSQPLARPHRRPPEPAPRVTRPQLVHRTRRKSPRMLGRHTIRPRQRVPNHTRRQVSTAIRQRCSRPAVIPQKRVAPEHPMPLTEVPVQTPIKLVRRRLVIPLVPVIIRPGLAAHGIPLRQARRHPIQARRRNRIPHKRIPRKSGLRAPRRRRIKNWLRKNAPPLRQGRHRAHPHHPGVQPRALPVSKEESPVLLHRTAHHKSILVPPESRLVPASRKQVPSVQLLIPEELKHRPMQRVRPRLLVHHDDAAIAPPVLRRIAVRLHPKRVNRIHNRIKRHLTRLRLQHADPVVDVFTHPRPAPVNPRQHAPRRQAHPRRQRNQRNKIPPVQRQRHHLPLLHHIAHRPPPRLQQRRLAIHIHRLPVLAQPQRHVQAHPVPHPQHHTLPLHRRKPASRNRNPVLPRWQRQKRNVLSLRPCRPPRPRMRHRHHRPMNRQPGRVQHAHQQLALRRLTVHQHRHPQHCQPSPHSVMLTRHCLLQRTPQSKESPDLPQQQLPRGLHPSRRSLLIQLLPDPR